MNTLLEARDLKKSFRGNAALAGVSLALAPGELLGLVGPDGAGKTTLLRSLVGLMRVDAGVATIDGVAWPSAPPDAREAIGYMPQQHSLYGDLSVDENLTFFADLFGLARRTFQERRARLLGITRLEAARDRPAGALSGGMYKKLAIACALLHHPRALLLDEPTNGVDPVSRRELWTLLGEFVAEGIGVLVATPYMDEAARCGRVVLLHRGKVLASGNPTELVAGMGDSVFEILTHDRRRALELLENHPDVVSVTPAGEHVHAVLRRGVSDDLLRELSLIPATVRAARADFEDLYLSLIGAEA